MTGPQKLLEVGDSRGLHPHAIGFNILLRACDHLLNRKPNPDDSIVRLYFNFKERSVANQVCALESCGKPIKPGDTPYMLMGSKELYCSSECSRLAFDLGRKKSKKKSRSFVVAPEGEVEQVQQETEEETDEETEEENNVQRVAEDFGDAGIVRHFCDRQECGKPITLSWKGRYGEYCSNTCLKLSEKQGDRKMNAAPETETATTTETPKPITSGKSSKKPAAKKAAAKSAKAAKPKAESNGAGSGIISLTGKDPEVRGRRLVIYKMIKNGMTVERFRNAVSNKFPAYKGNTLSNITLRVFEESGLVKVK